MKIHWATCLSGLLLTSLFIPGQAVAETARSIGTVTEVSTQFEGRSVIVLNFDFPEFREGFGLEVMTASIEWSHSGLQDNTILRFEGYVAPGFDVRNQSARIRDGNIEQVLAEDPLLEGAVYPQDYRRTGGGHLHIDVGTVVASLVDDSRAGLQLIIVTEDMESSNLANAESPPQLIINYGFLGEMKEVLGRHR